jgi:hypothetical protein
MDWRLRQFSWWLMVSAGAVLLAGCVERRFVINSDPQGAVVFQNGQPLGAAPADNHFVYYGHYRFTLVKDGYETLVVDQDVPAPWYEYPGLDFISENLVPFTIRDRREFSYHLEPARIPSAMELLNKGQELRSRGQQLMPLPGTTPVPVAPPPTPVLPPPTVP